MPIVPRYSTPQVQSNPLPASRGTSAATPELVGGLAAQQGQQLGQALTGLGNDLSKIAIDTQQQANQVRVDDAVNQAQAARLALTYDKDLGYANLRGVNALERPDNAPLPDEYAGKLKDRLTAISGSLGNDAQRLAFQLRANDMLTQFQAEVSRHFVAQSNVYRDDTDTATIENRKAMIAAEFNNPTAIDEAINGRVVDIDGVKVLTDKGIKQAVYDMAKRNGKPAEWAEMEIRRNVSSAYGSVVIQMMEADPFAAKRFMDAHRDQFEPKDVLMLQRTLDPVITRRKGEVAGEEIVKGSGPIGTEAGDVIGWIMRNEGGYVADDAGKGPTNFGINQAANPDVDVAKLKPDQAASIYKKRYWDAIGADQLPPEMRAIAMDAAVNQGVGKAKELLAKADGDAQKLIDLRRAEYKSLVASDPARYGRYEKVWNSRLDELQGAIGTGGTTLSGLLYQADSIADPEERKVAKATIESRFKQDKLAETETYQKTLAQAQETAFAKVGGWRDIPATQWGSLKKEDQAKLMAGPPKHSDPDTLFMLQSHPEKWKAGEIEQYRPLLSESDFRTLYAKGNGPDAENKTRAATIDTNQFNDALTKAGLGKLLVEKGRSDADKATLFDLRARFEQVIDDEQQTKKRALTLDEKNSILSTLIKPVMVKMIRTGAWFGNGPIAPEERRVFQVKNPANIIIPDEARTKILAAMKMRNITPTEQNILGAYLRMDSTK